MKLLNESGRCVYKLFVGGIELRREKMEINEKKN